MATGTEIASAYVALTVRAPGIQKDIAKQLGAVDGAGAGQQIGNKVANGMKKTLQVAGVGIAGVLGTALVKGFGRLKAIETAQAKMRGLGNDADTVAKAMDNSLAAVKGTAFGLGDAASAASQLMAANIKPGKELEGILKTVGNNASAAGVGFDEMGSIFAKAATQANGVQNDIISQLADKGIPIYQALADQMGVTAGEVFKMASEGKVDFDTFAAAAQSAAGTVADEMGKTTTGSFDNLMAAMGRLGAKILEDVYPLIGPLFQDITRWLDEATTRVEPLVAAFGEWLKNASMWLKENIELIKGVAIALGSIVAGVFAVKAGIAVFNAYKTAVAGVKGAILLAKLAQDGWNISTRGGIGIQAAATGATKAQTFALKAGAVAQRVFNAVMNANPLMKIVGLVTLIVGALTYFFTQTELGKTIWAEFTRFLGEAWANISGFFIAAYENVIKPVFDGIAKVAAWVFENVLRPAFEVAQFAFAILGGIIQGVWETFIKPAIDGIGAVVMWLWKVAIKPALDATGAAFRWLWNNVISPVANWISEKWRILGLATQLMWKMYIQPAFKAIGDALNWVWVNVISPVVDWIRKRWEVLGLATRLMYSQYIKPAWDAVAGVIRTVWNKVKSVIDTMVRVIRSDPKKAFEAARDAIGSAWKGIQDLAKKPVRFVIETVINGLINTINKIPGVNLAKVPLPKGFSEGGYTGNIAPNAVAGVVHGNEHVIRAESRRAIESRHPGLLDHMNQYGSIPGYRKGGLVNPLPQGSYSVSQPYHGGHNGIDLAAPSGTKVYAAGSGTVGLAGSVNMGGNEVYIQHDNGLGTRYSHLSRFGTRAGASVKAGNVIGYVGSTGMSTGPHLHYMVHNPGGGAGNYGSHVNPAAYMGLQGKDLGEAGGAASILDGLVDWAVGKIKGAFPGGGMWIDVASALAKDAAGKMAKAFNPFAAADGHTTLYDNGGWLPTGKSLVENKTGRPEPILTGSQWDALMAGNSSNGARRVTVYIGARPFEGWMDERADAAFDRGLEDELRSARFASYG
ncbi:peptidoglycan DD-metalloendopeptidase family protein [Leucobacter sp. NPDC077196]|uniref:peptidoglycan DD-metalloendopeptidase family protein n=1 Tax=Leucobacter sp. NPDC077196 TaxID=3154959 RepID=UPI003421E2DC